MFLSRPAAPGRRAPAVRNDPPRVRPGRDAPPARTRAGATHMGPLIPPSFRTRQKWIMINKDAANGIATQCRT